MLHLLHHQQSGHSFTDGANEKSAVLIIGGWFLSLLVNILVSVWLTVLLLQKELQLTVKSVHFINVAIFIFQLLYFFL